MKSGFQVQSEIVDSKRVEVRLVDTPTPTLLDDEVLVRVEAAPVNPSDLGVLLGPAKIDDLHTTDDGVLSAVVDEGLMPRFSARGADVIPVGIEGSGIVIGAGVNPEAQALLGRVVSLAAGSMYSEYRVVPAAMCFPLKEGTSPKEAAAGFVNPLTALSMIETMNIEGHRALVHTAAASNLGQMLVKLCAKDSIGLVNIVRKDEQADMLKSMGAKYVCNSSQASFLDDLTEAIHETGATLAFDATGGGPLADQILTAMERAQLRGQPGYSAYGSTTHKQVYLYGQLDVSSTVLARTYGMSWGVGGWLVAPILNKIGPERVASLRNRVAEELGTTFASHFTQEISFKELLSANIAKQYAARKTGEKYLLCPHKY